MLLQALAWRPSISESHRLHYRRQIPSLFPLASPYGLRLSGAMNVWFWGRRGRRLMVSVSEDERSGLPVEKTRKIVEHVCLLKAKEDLSDENEQNMLDYLYTTQYQMHGIIAISLGRICNDNVENYTHAVYMRFQRKDDVKKFYENSFYLGVLKDHVMPYCHELNNMDYESEVEDDIIPIFRKGEEFNYGVEFIHLIGFDKSALGAPAEDALVSLERLTKEFPSLIVQSTQGSIFNLNNEEYTHVVVTRFRSLEAFEIFMGSTEYKDLWRSKFEPITRKALPVHFAVDPVGKEIM